MRRLPSVDLRMYLDAVPLLVRTPALLLAPVLMAVVAILLTQFLQLGAGDAAGGGFGGGIAGLIFFLLDAFGLGVSLIIADTAWRRGKATFDDGWVEARRKAGDILMAAVGLSFVTYVAQLVGSILPIPFLGIALYALSYYFLIYTIPAAAIGGLPGGAALSASIERVKSNYLAAFLLVVTYLVLVVYLAQIAVLSLGNFGIASFLIAAVAKSIAIAYFSLVLAKSYVNASYHRY